MAFFYMGFSCENVLEKSDDTSPFGDGMIVISNNDQNGMNHESEFWPIEHPIEPLDEDQPIKCPMLNSSVVNNGRMHDEHFSENLRKRAEQQSQKERRVVVPAAEAPTLRTLRKRHHTHTNIDDHAVSPFLRMPPRDLTIFDMLQQFDKV